MFSRREYNWIGQNSTQPPTHPSIIHQSSCSFSVVKTDDMLYLLHVERLSRGTVVDISMKAIHDPNNFSSYTKVG